MERKNKSRRAKHFKWVQEYKNVTLCGIRTTKKTKLSLFAHKK